MKCPQYFQHELKLPWQLQFVLLIYFLSNIPNIQGVSEKKYGETLRLLLFRGTADKNVGTIRKVQCMSPQNNTN